MNIEEPKKLVLGLAFTFIFPLFGIFLFSEFEFMGIRLYSDIFLGFDGSFINSIYEWFFSLFRGDIINQFMLFGAQSIIQEPIAPSILTWFTVGFLTGVLVKNLKRTFLISLITPLFHFILLIIFAFFNGSLIDLFTVNLMILSGGLIIAFFFIFMGSYLGSMAGK